MKKGFTLIELLAVILILGIIALIAIPTVNNIISEARYGAFKSGNENIMKTIEQDCQTSIMKGETPILSYLFTEGKSSNEINIKGSLPNDGYIFLNRSCEITDYYLTDNKNVYLNGNDVREDYMLMKAENGQSIFKDLYASHYENILNVIIINNLVIPENAIGVTDISLSKNGKIKSWLIPNGNSYDLYIGSEGTIYANYNSRYLFADLINVMNINVEKINTNFVTNAEKMFYNCLNIEEINMSNFITDNMQNINSIFANCKKIKNIDVSKWKTSNIKNFTYTFLSCENVKTLDVLNWDLSSAIEIGGLFQCCYSLRSVDLTNWNISNVTVINSLFNSCYALNYIGNISNWDTSNVIAMRYLFQSCGVIKEINLSNWNVSNVTDFTGIFRQSYNLEKINLLNWKFKDDAIVDEFMLLSNNINNIILHDINSVNLIADVLIDRSTNTIGTITTDNNKNNLNVSVLTSKNWNIV